MSRAISFDGVAALYDEVRPGYPRALFDDLLTLARVPPSGRVLEVGAGTGQATESLAQMGLEILALEPGAGLAALARRRLSRFPGVSVVNARFEDWPPESGAFDLVTSATAFHWVDPDVGYAKAAACLRPSGAIGLFWNVQVAGPSSDAFVRVVQPAYARWTPSLAEAFHLPAPDAANGHGSPLVASGLFGEPSVRRYPWRETYDADRYVNLLRTFSDHIALPAEAKAGLLDTIREVIQTDFGGEIEIDRVAVLYVARPAGVR